MLDAYYAVTPIITVFWGNLTAAYHVAPASAQLSCVKLTGYSKMELDEMGYDGNVGDDMNGTVDGGNGTAAGSNGTVEKGNVTNVTEGGEGDSGVGKSEVPQVTAFALLVVACLQLLL